ncbi:MAG TPA: hypothetical protein VF049_02925 [Nocardioidaceae bacterium]
MDTRMTVVTLAGIRLEARCTRGAVGGPQVVFCDEKGRAVATCSGKDLATCHRTLTLRPGDNRWDLGPVELARILHLTQVDHRSIA